MEDFFANLPPELSNEILSYLNSDELLAASQVNRKWRRIVMNNEHLWKNICKFYDITDYTPPDLYETPFNDFCSSAKKYLIYEKVLKSNWISAKSHVLYRLSAVTTENITFWKRTFVRTYIEGNAVDIFNVDWQCNVNRLQRINTRYIHEGRDEVTLNDTWLTITRLNAISLYKIQPNGEYKLSWIFTVTCNETLPIKYIHVNDKTSFEDIDKFIQNHHSNNWILNCQCILNNKYIWLMAVECAIVISIDEHNGKAEVIQRFQAVSPESFCYDEKGVATYIQSGLGLFRPNGEAIYSYKLFPRVKNDKLEQNQSTVAFIQHYTENKVVLINRQTYNIVKIEEANAVMFCLHPTKSMVFILFRPNEFKQISRANDGFPWILRGYSSVNGDLIWSVEKWFKFKEMPEVPCFKIIHNKFLLMSPLHLGSHKYTLHSCNTGKLISITEEENPPVLISDVFKVCKFIAREVFIGVKCYL